MITYFSDTIMDGAASLNNDTPKTLYTYAVQLPYLIIAQQELEQNLVLNEVPLSLISEYKVDVQIGDIVLILPDDFFIPNYLMERPNTSTKESDFVRMTEVKDVNHLQRDPGVSLIEWDWRHNCINFVGATTIRNVRLNYWKQLLVPEIGSNEPQLGANNFLKFRTAALIAEFIAKDTGRSMSLNVQAMQANDLLMSILVKNNQGKRIRRHPFRVGRGYGWRVTTAR